MTNPWCEILGIEVPRVEAVTDHREASAYTLLIVTLLERGAPMTLPEVAARLEIAGVGAAADALAALVRCRPGRAPVYCDGDRYGLDPHDADLDLWAFRLGLRPPDSPPIGRFKPNPEPVPEPDVALTVSELDEAWKDANLASWSAQRLALAVLDAAGRPMAGHEVVAFVKARAPCHALRDDGRGFARRGSAVEILPDGRWSVAAGAGAAVEATRRAVRARVVVARRYARVDPAVIAAHQEQGERMRAAHAAALSKLRRGLVYALGTAKRPDAFVF